MKNMRYTVTRSHDTNDFICLKGRQGDVCRSLLAACLAAFHVMAHLFHSYGILLFPCTLNTVSRQCFFGRGSNDIIYEQSATWRREHFGWSGSGEDINPWLSVLFHSHNRITRNATVEGSGNFHHLVFLNMQLNLSTQVSSILPPWKCGHHGCEGTRVILKNFMKNMWCRIISSWASWCSLNILQQCNVWKRKKTEEGEETLSSSLSVPLPLQTPHHYNMFSKYVAHCAEPIRTSYSDSSQDSWFKTRKGWSRTCI